MLKVKRKPQLTEKPHVEGTLYFTALVLSFSYASFVALQTKSFRDLGSCHKELYVAQKNTNSDVD